VESAEANFVQHYHHTQEKEATEPKPKPKVPEIHAPAVGGTQLETPKIEVIREPTPDRKSSLAPGV
jgi:hypothetical protein